MKSPWKFLAQFIPQRRSAETPERSTGHDPDPERGQSEPQQSSGFPLDVTEDPRGSEHKESQPIEVLTTSTSDQFEPEIDPAPGVAVREDVKEFPVPARRRALRSTSKSYALRVESEPNEKSQRTPPTKKLERTKRTRADTIAQSAASVRDKTDQASSSREAFFDEVVDLDEDIKQLKIQLARKLHLQNDQLKNMLKRFDVL
jgi:hypothetical protein